MRTPDTPAAEDLRRAQALLVSLYLARLCILLSVIGLIGLAWWVA